jgi:hypothetical protein
MSQIADMTMVQLIAKVDECQRTIENAQQSKDFWLSEINRQVVLANEAVNGKTEVLWGWEDEVK